MPGGDLGPGGLYELAVYMTPVYFSV